VTGPEIISLAGRQGRRCTHIRRCSLPAPFATFASIVANAGKAAGRVRTVISEPRLFAGRFDCGHEPNRLRDLRKLRGRRKAFQRRPERGVGVGVASASAVKLGEGERLWRTSSRPIARPGPRSAKPSTPWKPPSPTRKLSPPALATPHIGRVRERTISRRRSKQAFAEELKKTAAISAHSPELGERARAVLEARKAFCLARLEEAFAEHALAETANDSASGTEDEALMAICEHRCSSLEEAALRAEYLADSRIDLQTENIDALLASFLPEGEELTEI
jgi:hypothetical protein